MKNIEDRTILVTDENGKDIEGTIIFTFEANGEDFVLYEIGEEAFAAKVSEEGNLSPVLEDEWKLVEKIYNEFLEDQDKYEVDEDE